MPDKKASNIARYQDGSIDYQYYADRGTMARNGELKAITEKILGAVQINTPAISSLLTVVMLVLLF